MAELQVPFRTTPIWPIPRSTLEYQASNRLKQLATPKVRNNIWSINMSEVGSPCHTLLSGWGSGDRCLWMQVRRWGHSLYGVGVGFTGSSEKLCPPALALEPYHSLLPLEAIWDQSNV